MIKNKSRFFTFLFQIILQFTYNPRFPLNGRFPRRRHRRNDRKYILHNPARLKKMRDFLQQEQADILKKIQEQS